MDGSSRADDGPASISQGLMTCSSGRQEARGSNSASPKKQQKEYLITGGCCQPTVSEVLGWVLPALWESTSPPLHGHSPRPGLYSHLGKGSRQDVPRRCHPCLP